MTVLVWVWLLLFAALLALVIRRGQRGGTLVLAYFVGLSVIHVPGALIHTSQVNYLLDAQVTNTGFAATLLGLFAFVVGAWVAQSQRVKPADDIGNLRLDYNRLGRVMFLLGFGVYFFAMPVLSFIPSATSIVSALGSLLPIGLWFWLYGAHITQNRRRFWLGLAMLPLLPLSTMVTGGFIGFGVYWVISVVAFVFCVVPRKRFFVLLAPAVLGLGLSFSVSYFGERNALREDVWNQRADLGGRMDRVWQMVTDFEWLDLDNPNHVEPLNARLNQNIFVGQAIDLRERGLTAPAYGETVPLWALIPRAIWPSKPAVGGSGDTVSRYTGQYFAEGTSVGIGQPLEFYINFGRLGVVLGFALLGYALMRLDIRLARAFKNCDVSGVLHAGLPGLALLQPGGSLMEILISFIGAMVAATLIVRLLKKSGLLEKGTFPARQVQSISGL